MRIAVDWEGVLRGLTVRHPLSAVDPVRPAARRFRPRRELDEAGSSLECFDHVGIDANVVILVCVRRGRRRRRRLPTLAEDHDPVSRCQRVLLWAVRSGRPRATAPTRNTLQQLVRNSSDVEVEDVGGRPRPASEARVAQGHGREVGTFGEKRLTSGNHPPRSARRTARRTRFLSPSAMVLTVCSKRPTRTLASSPGGSIYQAVKQMLDSSIPVVAALDRTSRRAPAARRKANLLLVHVPRLVGRLFSPPSDRPPSG
jgi:hypothetical protein